MREYAYYDMLPSLHQIVYFNDVMLKPEKYTTRYGSQVFSASEFEFFNRKL